VKNNGVADVYGGIRSGDCIALQLEVLAMRWIGTVSWLDLTMFFAAGAMLAIDVLQAVNTDYPEYGRKNVRK